MSLVSSALVSGAIWGVLGAFAAPPVEDPEPAPEASEDPPSKDPPPADDRGPVDVTKDLPRDERYDPILPYGETPPEQELEYADETPPQPELEYADETPPPPELGYDQSRQRQPPEDEAIERQSDLVDKPGEEHFQGRQASPQRFALEIKFGPYLPDVDARYQGDGFGPYATIYGRTDDSGMTVDQPRKGVFSVLGFEWQFYNLGGPFSLGTSIGYFRDSADALIDEPVMDGESLRSSADKTNFHVVPITLLLGYRFELLADRFRVPLVPYARGGVAHGFWIEKKGGKLVTNAAGQQSRGSSWGWQVNLGLMLRLDFIERAAATDLDRLTGINHTYIFGEWQFSRLDGFGSDKAMSIGDDTFLVGLAIEF
ncbi:MAG TPA: MXAN_2562 family outer membrane beta-barrel protein [Enhygromyxa sp.]|nr:MXAN_2562 family outer membrane beta-barrel protein [Enhygromyxa sp.]